MAAEAIQPARARWLRCDERQRGASKPPSLSWDSRPPRSPRVPHAAEASRLRRWAPSPSATVGKESGNQGPEDLARGPGLGVPVARAGPQVDVLGIRPGG